MFDKHYHTTYVHEDHSREAARILSDTLDSISKADVLSKDRVDISLVEYEKLKSDMYRYRDLSMQLEQLVANIGFPEDLIEFIDPNSVYVEEYHYPEDMTTHYRMVFSVSRLIPRK